MVSTLGSAARRRTPPTTPRRRPAARRAGARLEHAQRAVALTSWFSSGSAIDLRHRRDRRLVKHDLDTASPAPAALVADVAFESSILAAKSARFSRLPVEKLSMIADAFAARDQRARDRRADEAGAAGDEIASHG
jgi:hypothetical protein